MPGPAELAEVGQRLRDLEQECARLGEELGTQRTAAVRLRAHLDLLQQGVFPPGTRPVLLMVLLALLVAVVGGCLLWARAESAAMAWLGLPMPLEPVLPHLLVTSEPDGAEVVLDGVPRGQAPLLLTLPARAAEHRLAFTLPGWPGKVERVVRVGTTTGAHVHATLHLPSPRQQPGPHLPPQADH